MTALAPCPRARPGRPLRPWRVGRAAGGPGSSGRPAAAQASGAPGPRQTKADEVATMHHRGSSSGASALAPAMWRARLLRRGRRGHAACVPTWDRLAHNQRIH